VLEASLEAADYLIIHLSSFVNFPVERMLLLANPQADVTGEATKPSYSSIFMESMDSTHDKQ
jgi:hypothetical protein